MPVHGVGLAGVDHEQQLVVPLFVRHLAECVRQVPATDLLAVLELEELAPAMTRHIDQYITPFVGQEPLACGHTLVPAVAQQADEVLHRDLVAAVVDLDVLAVQVHAAVGVGVDGAREGVAWVAGHVVGEHEEDLRVGNAEAFDRAVEAERVREMAIVEPEATGRYEDLKGR